MKPQIEAVLRSPSGFFVTITTEGGESFVAQIVRSLTAGETTMRVRRIGRPSELVHLADVIEARPATRSDIAAAVSAEDSTASHEDVHRSHSASSCLPFGTSDEKKDGSR